jgi:hypothetical protein
VHGTALARASALTGWLGSNANFDTAIIIHANWPVTTTAHAISAYAIRLAVAETD